MNNKPISSSENKDTEKDEESALHFKRMEKYTTDYLKDLSTMGDNPDILREIIHFIMFRQERDRDLFLKEIDLEGFAMIGTFYQSQNDYPFSVEILKNEKTHLEDVTQFINIVGKCALAHHGIYNNWETVAISNIDEYKDRHEEN